MHGVKKRPTGPELRLASTHPELWSARDLSSSDCQPPSWRRRSFRHSIFLQNDLGDVSAGVALHLGGACLAADIDRHGPHGFRKDSRKAPLENGGLFGSVHNGLDWDSRPPFPEHFPGHGTVLLPRIHFARRRFRSSGSTGPVVAGLASRSRARATATRSAVAGPRQYQRQQGRQCPQADRARPEHPCPHDALLLPFRHPTGNGNRPAGRATGLVYGPWYAVNRIRATWLLFHTMPHPENDQEAMERPSPHPRLTTIPSFIRRKRSSPFEPWPRQHQGFLRLS